MAGRATKSKKTEKPLSIPLVEVESSNVHSTGHKGTTLRMKFHGDSVYDYFNVPEEQHQKLRAAESVGRYFHQHIRGKYEFKKVA